MNARASSRSPHAFSLIEVVLALGVASFALVSILGLLQVALDSDNTAGRDTTLAAMSSQVLNDLRNVPFDALWAADPESARDSKPSLSTVAPVASTYYFTYDGAPTAAADFGNRDINYKCVVTKTADVPTQSVTTGYSNQLKLQLVFTWPVIINPSTLKEVPTVKGSKTIYASIARH